VVGGSVRARARADSSMERIRGCPRVSSGYRRQPRGVRRDTPAAARRPKGHACSRAASEGTRRQPRGVRRDTPAAARRPKGHACRPSTACKYWSVLLSNPDQYIHAVPVMAVSGGTQLRRCGRMACARLPCAYALQPVPRRASFLRAQRARVPRPVSPGAHVAAAAVSPRRGGAAAVGPAAGLDDPCPLRPLHSPPVPHMDPRDRSAAVGPAASRPAAL
jgi:hypothetical protein